MNNQEIKDALDRWLRDEDDAEDTDGQLHDLAHGFVLGVPVREMRGWDANALNLEIDERLTALEDGTTLRKGPRLPWASHKRLRGRILRNELLTVAVHQLAVKELGGIYDSEVLEEAIYREWQDTHPEVVGAKHAGQEVWNRLEELRKTPRAMKLAYQMAKFIESYSK